VSLPPADLLLFTDAFDVLFTGGPTEIAFQYNEKIMIDMMT